MSHDHDHHHHHHHGAGSRLGLAFALNVSFTLVELVGAYLTNSTAIAADAVHDLGDSLALAFAWGMQGLSGRQATETFSYGFRRLSLVGALVNALVLVFGSILVLTESVPRLWDPPEAHAGGMLGLAVLGVLVNGAAVLRVRHGTTLNEQVVTWHLLEDVLGWVAVLVVSLVMMVVHAPILDPLLSVLITVWVLLQATRALRRTVDLFLQAVPSDVDVEGLAAAARAAGAVDLRHVHVWSQEGESHVLTGQLQVPPMPLEEAIAVRERVREVMEAQGIAHATLELTLSAEGDAIGCTKADTC